MQSACDQLLPSAGFAQNQHRRIGGSNGFHLFQDPSEGRTSADDFPKLTISNVESLPFSELRANRDEARSRSRLGAINLWFPRFFYCEHRRGSSAER